MLVAVVVGGGAVAFAVSAMIRSASHSSPANNPNGSPSPMQMPVTADSQLVAGGGTQVFGDDFTDPNSGWFTGTSASGSTYGYSSTGYAIAGRQSLHHLAFAPYTRTLKQMSMEVSATQTAGAPVGAGFGVTCDSGTGSSELHYELLVLQPGEWYVERYVGAIATSNTGQIIKQGFSSAAPSETPLTVTGMCATLADGRTTRMALFVNGSVVADVSDTWTADVPGWVGGVVAVSRSSEVTTVTFKKFVERDLSG